MTETKQPTDEPSEIRLKCGEFVPYAELPKEYSPFYWHNKALKEYPEYQTEGMMDVLREGLSMFMPFNPYPKEVKEYPERVQVGGGLPVEERIDKKAELPF